MHPFQADVISTARSIGPRVAKVSPTMKFPRVKIWKLSDAPKELQLLYKGLGTPTWVALVPQEIRGEDLDDVMSRSAKFNAPNGDAVFFGGPGINQISAEIVQSASPRVRSR